VPHSTQLGAPSTSLYLPIWQDPQVDSAVAATVSLDFPAAQGRQGEPSVGLKRPAVQSTQTSSEVPPLSEPLPARQEVQIVAPETENLAASQARQGEPFVGP